MWFKRKKTTEAENLSLLTGDLDIEEEKKLLAVIENLGEGILVFNRQAVLSLINPTAEKILEVKREIVLGKLFLRMTSFPNMAPIVSLLGGGFAEVSKQELKIRNGLVLEISTIPLTANGQKIGTLIVLRDVTREKLVEKMKSEFVTLAAHQLRTPTSAVKWSLRALIDGDLGNLSDQQKVFIERAYNTNDKVIQLIRDLLNVDKIEEGGFLSKKSLSDIEELIENVLTDYKTEIEKRKIKLIFEKPKTRPPKVMVDAERMRMAIANIIDNAAGYSFAGGKVTIFLKNDKEEIEIKIQDKGIGIPKNQQEKVFTKFFRADNAVKFETEGSGLGLYIAKNIIESHGGRIWFASKENKGSIFYFTIPVKEEFGEFITSEFY